MISLQNFYDKLQIIVGEQSVRPFVCDGNPLDTEVLIVGYNPAIATDFWCFFDKNNGFNKEKWLENYKENRKKNNKKTELSNTRRVIEWVSDDLIKQKNDIKIMVTNIFSYPTKRKKDLPQDKKQTEIFDFLIKNLKPKIIITHGNDTKEYINIMNLQTPIINSKHFAIGWSRNMAKELAENIFKYIR